MSLNPSSISSAPYHSPPPLIEIYYGQRFIREEGSIEATRQVCHSFVYSELYKFIPPNKNQQFWGRGFRNKTGQDCLKFLGSGS